MRKKVIAGNWKMNNDLNKAVELIEELKKSIPNLPQNTEVVICPPFISLERASTLLENTGISLGGQNMHYEKSGAYTGEISAAMLKSVGCRYVILGHSERRVIFGETDEMINKKVSAALNSSLKPIFCVGETLEQREQDITKSVIEKQVLTGLKNIKLNSPNDILIAYEPVWAIGTGKTATPQQAQKVHQFIRSLLTKVFSQADSDSIQILYGGSVKPENSAELLSQKDIDGALVGGACLDAVSFTKIVFS